MDEPGCDADGVASLVAAGGDNPEDASGAETVVEGELFPASSDPPTAAATTASAANPAGKASLKRLGSPT
jgi:hypothetical protein